jgi:charged multivesicular body protein 3
MEEMLEDTLEMDDDEELEEEADAEVDKVLFELTNGKLGQAGTINNELPVGFYRLLVRDPLSDLNSLQSVEDKQLEEETERNIEKYREQLNGILS